MFGDNITCPLGILHPPVFLQSTWSALTTACRKGHEEIVKVLVKAGADVNKKKKVRKKLFTDKRSELCSCLQGEVAALHIACYRGMIEVVKYIAPPCKTEKQRQSVIADVNIQDEVRAEVQVD